MDPVYVFMYDWAELVLNTQLSLGIPIIQSHQDTPDPVTEDPFITISYAPARRKVGRAHFSPVNPSTEKRNIINDTLFNVELREKNGTGELLEWLINSVDNDVVKAFWKDRGYSYMQQLSDIIPVPRIQQTKWERESMVEIQILTAKVHEEDLKYINTVKLTGTIPAQGRTGDHVIDSTIN